MTIKLILPFVAICIGLTNVNIAIADTNLNKLIVKPENRCSEYNRQDYSYPPSVEMTIIRLNKGKIYSPYTDETFSSYRQTDIEHIVALSEAHDSGMCARSKHDKRNFARDLLNLTLASPEVNRYQKRGKDVGEWLPEKNKCWFIERVILVKKKWRLSIDKNEANVLRTELSKCKK